MFYNVVFFERPRERQLRAMSTTVARRVVRKIERMRNDLNLAGDVKRLKSFVPDYRLRVGD